MTPPRERDITTLRAFNRTYTHRLGLLDAHLDKSPFTLSEARILYEIAHRTDPTAAEIGRALDLDRAQVSRTLRRFADRRLITTRENPAHGRHKLLSLTQNGRATFVALETSTREAVGKLLDNLPYFRRRRLLSAAATIAALFETKLPPELTLRGLRTGDLGFVAHRQAIIYAEEYGYNQDYEVLAARILADFHKSFDPARDAAWIANMDGQMVGSIFLMRGEESDVGKLRLLYVEPDARGTGVGKRLIDACVERARAAGYERLDLWTDSQLIAARRLYERTGFTLIQATPDHFFGQEILSETWSMAL